MTLHEAIEKVLKKEKRPMTTSEIANELNKNKWYLKNDGSAIHPFQIHGRTTKYNQIFIRNGSTVILKNQNTSKNYVVKKITDNIEINKKHFNTTSIEEMLLLEENFKSAIEIDNLVPNEPGLYCIRIIDPSILPQPFDSHLLERNHNIIYIGIASQSLLKRFLNQELRAKGHGTFFRSIGTLLGYKPERGSLQNMANKRIFKFKKNDEIEIINWINNNLKVNWIAYEGNFEFV